MIKGFSLHLTDSSLHQFSSSVILTRLMKIFMSEVPTVNNPNSYQDGKAVFYQGDLETTII